MLSHYAATGSQLYFLQTQYQYHLRLVYKGAQNLHVVIYISSGQSKICLLLLDRIEAAYALHYNVKLRQNLISSFRLMCNFFYPKIRKQLYASIRSQISQNLISSGVHHNTYSQQVVALIINDVNLFKNEISASQTNTDNVLCYCFELFSL